MTSLYGGKSASSTNRRVLKFWTLLGGALGTFVLLVLCLMYSYHMSFQRELSLQNQRKAEFLDAIGPYLRDHREDFREVFNQSGKRLVQYMEDHSDVVSLGNLELAQLKGLGVIAISVYNDNGEALLDLNPTFAFPTSLRDIPPASPWNATRQTADQSIEERISEFSPPYWVEGAETMLLDYWYISPRFSITQTGAMRLVRFTQKLSLPEALLTSKNPNQGYNWVLDMNGRILFHPDFKQRGSLLRILGQDGETNQNFYRILGGQHYDETIEVKRFQWQRNETPLINTLFPFPGYTGKVVVVSSIPKSVLRDRALSQITLMAAYLLASLSLIVLLIRLWIWFTREELARQASIKLALRMDDMVESRIGELDKMARTIKDMMDSIPSALIVLNPNLTITRVNLSFHDIFISQQANMVGQPIRDVLGEVFEERLRSILNTKEIIIDWEIRRTLPKLGEKVLKINVLHLMAEQGNLIVVVDDITERHALERQLIQSEKLAGIGTLATGIAHEINNPLNAISGMSQILKTRIKNEEQLDYLNEIITYTQRAAQIVKTLSTYSRATKVVDAAEISMEEIVEASLEIVKHSRKMDGITIERNYAQNLPLLFVNSVDIEQVLLNLITNAVDAMENMAAKQGDGFTMRMTMTTGRSGTDFVFLRVADNGIGMKKDVVDKIFNPFFSTKEQGKGTGLGLSISYKIIQRYGGTIGVKSDYKQGTEFIVKLPTSQAKSRMPSPTDTQEITKIKKGMV